MIYTFSEADRKKLVVLTKNAEPYFLAHHGVKGMKWGVRKNRSREKKRYGIDAIEYKFSDYLSKRGPKGVLRYHAVKPGEHSTKLKSLKLNRQETAVISQNGRVNGEEFIKTVKARKLHKFVSAAGTAIAIGTAAAAVVGGIPVSAYIAATTVSTAADIGTYANYLFKARKYDNAAKQ